MWRPLICFHVPWLIYQEVCLIALTQPWNSPAVLLATPMFRCCYQYHWAASLCLCSTCEIPPSSKLSPKQLARVVQQCINCCSLLCNEKIEGYWWIFVASRNAMVKSYTNATRLECSFYYNSISNLLTYGKPNPHGLHLMESQDGMSK